MSHGLAVTAAKPLSYNSYSEFNAAWIVGFSRFLYYPLFLIIHATSPTLLTQKIKSSLCMYL
jgi:hypothetical protein